MSLLSKTILLFICTSFFSFAFAQERRGGLSGTGGGSGVACFENEDLAAEAETFIKHNKILPKELLAKASLKVLESWEMEQTQQTMWKAKDFETWEQHLENVKNKIRDHFPLFMYRLDQVEDLTEFRQWQNTETLQLLEDANPIKTIPNNCRRIQLALRYSEGDNAIGIGPVTSRPKIKISFIKPYVEKLSQTDMSMLSFHEQLYVLGKSIGHESSDHTRKFVRTFFALTTFGNSSWMTRSRAEARIKYDLVLYFGDYLMYFIDSNPLQQSEFYTAEHQFATYLSFMKKAREQVGECRRKAEASGADGSRCMMKVMDGIRDSGELTKEEAFLFIATFNLENMGINTDHLMNPKARDANRFEISMKNTCRVIAERMNSSFEMVSKALQYCEEFRPGLTNDPRK